MVNCIGGIYLFIGKIFIACFTAYICYMILNNYEFTPPIFSPILTTAFCFCLAYLIGIMFMSVYGNFYFNTRKGIGRQV